MGRDDRRDGPTDRPAPPAADAADREASTNPWATRRRDTRGAVVEGRSPAPAARATAAEVEAFVARVRAMSQTARGETGRLLFAMDATMSRQPTWDLALGLQSDMFRAVEEIGGLLVQLVYFRGLSECRASRWVSDTEALSRLMTRVACQGGSTQIGRVLTHARNEMAVARVHALVYVGDSMEEDIDALCAQAGQLGLLGLPMFLFQEGRDARASTAFAELARLTLGAHCRFDRGSAAQLRELLTAVAAYAAGGRKALERLVDANAGARQLIEQLR